MSDSLKQNLKSGSTWKRGLFMLLFVVLYSVAEFVLTATVLFQFGARLITGRVNLRLLRFGQSLATYIYQIILFQTFKTETMPYPFEVWPKGPPDNSTKKRAKESPPAAEPVEAENYGGNDVANGG